jgi:hypothetical protein
VDDEASDGGAPPNERPGAIRTRKNEAFGVRLFTPAPTGFHPIAASPRELLRYGFSARPDPVLKPRLHKLWTKMLSRPMRIVEPQFAVMKGQGHGRRKAYGLPTGNGWCGSVAFASSVAAGPPNPPVPESVAFVMGQ